MRAPDFWWRREIGWLARLLSPLGWLYGAVTLARMRRAGATASAPVICVGNLVAGGAGKTPTALALAGLLRARGETPFVLMRGYGGRLAGPVEVDPGRHRALDVGDEAMLTAARVPTIVARDRPAGAALAATLGASVVVMDDGLQNPSLVKTLRLAVVDGASGVGNGLCMPAGPLRAALDGQLRATDAVIVIGPGAPGDAVAEAARTAGLPVLKARIEPEPAISAQCAGRRVLAVAGIGRPEKFAVTLREAGATIVAQRSFPDHHAYGPADVATLIAEAASRDCLIATTQKDWVKLEALWPPAQRGRVLVLPITLRFEAPNQIETLLDAASARSGPAGATQA